jgi:hypothetical protein
VKFAPPSTILLHCTCRNNFHVEDGRSPARINVPRGGSQAEVQFSLRAHSKALKLIHLQLDLEIEDRSIEEKKIV